MRPSFWTAEDEARVLALLEDGRFHPVREIAEKTGVKAVNAVVTSLRDKGHDIRCRQRIEPNGRRRWAFRLNGRTHTLFHPFRE